MAKHNNENYNQRIAEEALRIIKLKMKQLGENISIDQVSMLQRFAAQFNSSN